MKSPNINELRRRLIWFGLWVAVLTMVFWLPLGKLVRESFEAGYSSHIVLIPFLSAYLIWTGRSKIFSESEFARNWGVWIGFFGCIAGLVAAFQPDSFGVDLRPLLTVLSAILLVMSGFVFVFGKKALGSAAFPFLLLALTLPVPGFLLNRIIGWLQSGSAYLSTSIFSLLGVPVFRNEFMIAVPGVTVEVARECSGINSTIALFILTLLIAHETLRTTSRRLALVLLIFPLSILKNAIRIVTLTLLASKVDPSFLTGNLHHDGGFVFFLVTLAIAWPIWKALKRSENRGSQAASINSTRASAANSLT